MQEEHNTTGFSRGSDLPEYRDIGTTLPSAGTIAPASTAPVAGRSEGPVAKRVLKWKGIDEVVRTAKTSISSCKPPFEGEEGSEADINAIIQRAELVRSPLGSTPAPTGTSTYGTLDQLFARV